MHVQRADYCSFDDNDPALLERSLSTPQRQISLITPRSLLLALVVLGKMSHQSTNDVPDV